jgi:hypothetical protein
MRSPHHTLSGDRKGIVVAAICLVHCVAGPLLLSLAGFASLIGVSEKVEPAFYLTSAVLGASTLIPAYRKRHRRMTCLVLFFAGMACLFGRRYLSFLTGPLELAAVGVGGGLIIAAHALNLRFSKTCPCCQPGTDEDGAVETNSWR